jgi:hypothetical protein
MVGDKKRQTYFELEKGARSSVTPQEVLHTGAAAI